MRNYIEGLKKTFVTGYKLIGSSIVVKYADGRKEVLPYQAITEKELLEKMEKQAHYAINGPFIKSQKVLLYSLLFTPVILYCAAVFSSVLLALFGIACGFTNIYEHSKRINEIRKFKFFLANKKELYESVELVNQNKDLNDNEKIDDFSINTIDNYSLRKLKKLRNELQRYNNKKSNIFTNNNSKKLVLIKDKKIVM